jgi:hypothetical protein
MLAPFFDMTEEIGAGDDAFKREKDAEASFSRRSAINSQTAIAALEMLESFGLTIPI